MNDDSSILVMDRDFLEGRSRVAYRPEPVDESPPDVGRAAILERSVGVGLVGLLVGMAAGFLSGAFGPVALSPLAGLLGGYLTMRWRLWDLRPSQAEMRDLLPAVIAGAAALGLAITLGSPLDSIGAAFVGGPIAAVIAGMMMAWRELHF